MKPESLVIAGQPYGGEFVPGLVHTARHTMGAGHARSRYLNRKEGDAEGRASDWSEVVTRPRTTRSPFSFWGDGGIVPFEPFFHAFPGGLEKAAINRIFQILPSRKEEREILFPFRRDQEIGSSRKKNACLINNSLLGLRPPQSLRTPPISAMGCVYLSIS
ncbi:hypothetical protein FNV43_RR05838 [Rhamnella rubrinervis]|uniref:Uncharacterized protein n=1 Tax=Rhamnella rubrinervis TaxID=2594499 RepID=A0A8K0HDB2_9ROSA|nr:hypothetical protein FNV43_RR05838 [Rhamnella rubrinervis]